MYWVRTALRWQSHLLLGHVTWKKGGHLPRRHGAQGAAAKQLAVAGLVHLVQHVVTAVGNGVAVLSDDPLDGACLHEVRQLCVRLVRRHHKANALLTQYLHMCDICTQWRMSVQLVCTYHHEFVAHVRSHIH